MLPFFYVPPTAFLSGSELILPSSEAVHAVRVLRLRAGDEIIVVNGKGLAARVRLTHADKGDVRGDVLSLEKDLGESNVQLTIGLSLLKQRARFETFLEKAVELGAYAVQPLVTERTEVAAWRHARAHNIMVGAMKQCQRSRLPQLHEPKKFEDVLTPHSLVAHAQADVFIMDLLWPLPPALQILIGPEGGFSDAEIALALKMQSALVRLGPRRLRAETAAIAACAAVMLMHH